MVRQFPFNMHFLRQQFLPGALGVLAVLLLLEGSDALNFQRGQLATLEDTRELFDDLQRDKRFPRLLVRITSFSVSFKIYSILGPIWE